MNTAGCSAGRFSAYKRTENMTGAPPKKFMSLTQTKLFASYVSLIISAIISNDTKLKLNCNCYSGISNNV